MKTKKEFIISIIENMNEEEINFMEDLFSEEVYYNTHQILKLFAPEVNQKKVDTAYPCDYAGRIADVYPDFRNGLNVYNYNSNTFGEMLNVNNLIAKKIRVFFTGVLKKYIEKI